ncbi:MAG TPA: UbiA family prenyltransferase [Nocardioidaceae bacterium]|nr:UbiA family prenyltransferase [Nocardioidaceae bacterium]
MAQQEGRASQSSEPGAGGQGAALKALLGACHPAPVVAVTTIATVLAVVVGAAPMTVVLVALAFLTGQLSIGWSNDWIDALRDASVGRQDKPVATGAVTAGQVRTAAFGAAILTVPASLALGTLAGGSQLVVVAAGWAYNAGLKATSWSWAPYAVAFGLLPAVVVLALPGSPWPPVWMMLAGALLGVGAHLLNVLPDLEEDRSTGVRGLPHRLGRSAAGVLAAIVLLLASALVVVGPAGAVGPVGWAMLIVAAGAAAVATTASFSGDRRVALIATATVAIVNVVALLASGGTLTR